jgi:Transposase DDE domain group 1
METLHAQADHKIAPASFTPLFGGPAVLLAETPKAVTPFGGLASFVAFLQQIGFGARVAQAMPFPVPSSPNAIALAHTFTAFFFAVVTGASRFAHTDWLRGDRALHALLGIKRFPGDDTVRGFFKRFGQAQVEAFWRPLWAWLLSLLPGSAAGFHLDLDSTVFGRDGQQEGAAKGYNPQRRGRKSHHPLVAVLAEVQFVLHGWLRSGNCGSARGVEAFLAEALTLAPSHLRIACVRADSGFFADGLLTVLEARGLPYIVVARVTSSVRNACVGLAEWRAVDENYSVGEVRLKLHGWSVERRFVVLRERVRENKSAVGRRLIEVPGYTYRIFVTNRTESAEVIWRDYNGRACIEQRIEELKNDLSADGFCVREFYGTESAFLAVLFAFNLLGLYQRQIAPDAPYRQPSTLRAQVFVAGAVLGLVGKQVALKLSCAWGGLSKHKPLLDSVLKWVTPTPPKLISDLPAARAMGASP